eukprot:TRINITY_DN27440_c0_g2_i1.p1 TRINITY_DN27440_c0_g2~~TRINITY_DN27440_c0_g2_i1.p1  ORF type:complete len:635 (+),score=117.32 TRINITY_DN27440_c0_g2_i1:98-1906(+)
MPHYGSSTGSTEGGWQLSLKKGADGRMRCRTHGVIVSHVGRGGPADAGGLRVGMQILSINGKPMLRGRDITTAFSRVQPGGKLQVIVSSTLHSPPRTSVTGSVGGSCGATPRPRHDPDAAGGPSEAVRPPPAGGAGRRPDWSAAQSARGHSPARVSVVSPRLGDRSRPESPVPIPGLKSVAFAPRCIASREPSESADRAPPTEPAPQQAPAGGSAAEQAAAPQEDPPAARSEGPLPQGQEEAGRKQQSPDSGPPPQAHHRAPVPPLAVHMSGAHSPSCPPTGAAASADAPPAQSEPPPAPPPAGGDAAAAGPPHAAQAADPEPAQAAAASDPPQLPRTDPLPPDEEKPSPPPTGHSTSPDAPQAERWPGDAATPPRPAAQPEAAAWAERSRCRVAVQRGSWAAVARPQPPDDVQSPLQRRGSGSRPAAFRLDSPTSAGRSAAARPAASASPHRSPPADSSALYRCGASSAYTAALFPAAAAGEPVVAAAAIAAAPRAGGAMRALTTELADAVRQLNGALSHDTGPGTAWRETDRLLLLLAEREEETRRLQAELRTERRARREAEHARDTALRRIVALEHERKVNSSFGLAPKHKQPHQPGLR